MSESEFRKIQLEQRKLSNAPPKVRIMLDKRSHSNLNDENLNRTHRRIKIR